MKAKIVRSLLLVATVLSVGVSSVPVMAVDLSPDADADSGISLDADDSSTITPDDGTTVSPDNNTGLVPDDTTGNTGTGIVPDGEGTITPDNPQQIVTPTPIPGVTTTPSEDGVPQVTWDLQYDNTGEDGNYGLVRLKPSVTEGGHIVCAYKIDGQWGTYFTGSVVEDGILKQEGTKVTYTDSMDTWTIIPTSVEDTSKDGVRGADEYGYYSFDLNHGWNRDIPGKHTIQFYYYFWFDDLQKGSEVYLSTFDADFTDGVIKNDEDTDVFQTDLSINVALKSQNPWSKTYSINFTTQGSKLSDCNILRKNDEDYGFYLDDCKGYTNYTFDKTFSSNGDYIIYANLEDGGFEFYELTVTGIDESAYPTDDTVNGNTVVAEAPVLTVSGVPEANSVEVGKIINLVVTANTSCTLSGDNIEMPVDGTSVTVPVDSNGTYEFFGTLSDGTYGRTTVTVNCFKDTFKPTSTSSSSNSPTKSYSSLEDFWGNQLQDKLPQTGTIGLSSVIGLGIAGMASGLVLMKKKRYTSDIEDEEAEDNEK